MTDIEHAASIADHGRADEAALILERLLRAEPECWSARRVLGKIYIDLTRLDDAVSVLRDIGQPAKAAEYMMSALPG